MPYQPARSLAAIVFTDVVGYSKLVHRDDARALKLLGEHFRLVREAARRYGGREIKTIGDSVHLEFASAQSATTCAIAIQQAHQQRNARVAADDRFEIRIGLHLGDIEHRDGDVYGDGVNIAARLQPLAPVGGIAISEDVRRQLVEDLRHRFASLGEQALKNIDTPVEVFALEPRALAEIALDTPASSPRAAARSRPAWIRYFVAVAIAALVPLAGLIVATLPFLHHDKPTAPPATASDKSIAVLPFESLSEDKANAYFAEGIQDQILTGLAKIGDLKVISRTSTQRYASRPENLSKIAVELGVAHILEGSVQRAGNRVRINVQLIDARSDNHLWADTFDRTLDDIFAVQSEVAQKIADSLSARLTQRERAALTEKPTENAQAYSAYLKARALFAKVTTTRAQYDEVLDAYREAVRLDPGFAIAWAELARIDILTVWSGFDPTGELRDEARRALARATALAPKLPQVELSRAVMLYYDDLDFAGAAAIVDSLKSELPGDAFVWSLSGLLARRLAAWDRAIADMEKARTLQPHDASLTFNLAVTHAARFQFPAAIALLDESLALQPDEANALTEKLAFLSLQGDTVQAERVAAAADSKVPAVQAMQGIVALHRRDYSAATRALRLAVASGDDSRLDAWFEGYIPALVEWQLLLGLSEQRAGDVAAARADFEQVRSRATRVLAGRPETRYVQGWWELALGLALAGLGKADEARAHGERGVTINSPDPLEEPQAKSYLARIHAWNGDAARAVPLARALTRTICSFVTPELLKIDSQWDRVREDPSFQALIESPPR